MEGDLHYRAVGGTFALADGTAESLLALYNKAASRYLMLVDRVWVLTASLVAVTGVGIELNFERISALTETGGTAGVLRPLILGADMDGDIATSIAVYGSGTATGSGILAYRAVNNDEISLTGQAPWAAEPIWEAMHSPGGSDGAVYCSPGEGVNMEQVTASTAGAWVVGYDFRLRARRPRHV